MTDTEIRDVLIRAAEGLNPRPDLLQGVRRAGNRTLLRRRTVLGAGVAATVAGSTAGLLTARRGAYPVTDEDRILARATAGDLLGDHAFLRQVLACWQKYAVDRRAEEPVAGRPHVLWAGSTPVGPAAYVVQRAARGAADPAEMVLGFVVSTSTGLAMSGWTYWEAKDIVDSPTAILLGERRDVLVVVNATAPLRYSTALSFRADGRNARVFRPVPLTHGAAVLTVPSQRERITVALVRESPSGPQPVLIENVDDLTTTSGRRSTNRIGSGYDLDRGPSAWPGVLEIDAARRTWADPVLRPYLDVGGYPPYTLAPNLELRGTTPDGRRLLVVTEATSFGQARVFAVLGRPDAVPQVRYAGVWSTVGPLQLQLRLPDRQGVVVAHPDATLRYRSGKGPWIRLVIPAGLLPPSATEVEVTGGVSSPTRVPLR